MKVSNPRKLMWAEIYLWGALGKFGNWDPRKVFMGKFFGRGKISGEISSQTFFSGVAVLRSLEIC